MTQEELDQATEFMSSMHGRYILGKALFYGVRELNKVEGVHKEVSDISDMQYLQDTIFKFPDEVYQRANLFEKGAVAPV